MLVALACGFAQVSVLMAPRSDHSVLHSECALAQAIAPANSLHLLDLNDPDALCARLYEQELHPVSGTPVLPMGTRRQATRLAAKSLHPEGGTLPLPEAAPYGAVLVNTDSCTLCLSWCPYVCTCKV